jgi:type I restriction enzyme R subunit
MTYLSKSVDPATFRFINGLPIAVLELKNPADEDADIWKAFDQLQTYKEQIPDLFVTNELLVIADSVTARVGSLTADKEWFMQWRTIDGEKLDALLRRQDHHRARNEKPDAGRGDGSQ